MPKNYGGVIIFWKIFKKKASHRDVLTFARGLLNRAINEKRIPNLKVTKEQNLIVHAVGKVEDTDTYVFVMVVGTTDREFVQKLIERTNKPFGLSDTQYR